MTSPQALNSDLSQQTFFPSVILDHRLQGGSTIWGDQKPLGTPPKTTRSSVFAIPESRAFFQNNQVTLDQDLTNLKKSYGFPAGDSVPTFLANHPAISSALLSAVPHWKEAFGSDSVVNLEVLTDNDGLQTLYAVVVWRNAVSKAVQALEQFSENWWLHHMTASTADLAFTYDIS